MDISIIVCTYNRASDLKDAIESLLTQEGQDNFSLEILVVDNNSTDNTKAVVDIFLSSAGNRLRYIFEPKQGLSSARNRGTKEAKGDIVAFTDDDCIVDPKWAQELYYCFKKNNADIVGGKSLPIWPSTPARWLFNKCIFGKLSLLDYGDHEFQIKSIDRELYGCNIAFRKSKLMRFGMFNEDLGRKGTSLLAGEETELFQKFLDAGEVIFYEPKSIVHHKVLQGRMTKDFFRKRCFGGGMTTVLMSKETNISKAFLGVPLYLFKDLSLCLIRWLINIFDEDRRLFFELEISYILGRTVAYAQRRNPRI